MENDSKVNTHGLMEKIKQRRIQWLKSESVIQCKTCLKYFKKNNNQLILKELNKEWFCSQECQNISDIKQKDKKDKLKTKQIKLAIQKLPIRFKDKTIDNYNNPPQQIYQYINNPKSLLLAGNVGTGKTHLAVGLYKKLLEMDRKVKFIPSVEMLYDIRRNVTKDIDAAINNYTKYEYLIIDDIGAEKMTDWVKEIFYLIIDRQYRDMKHIVITTNMSSEEMSSNLDYRVVSRLMEMGDVIKFNGKDNRL